MRIGDNSTDNVLIYAELSAPYDDIKYAYGGLTVI